jgi:hypothetical protein
MLVGYILLNVGLVLLINGLLLLGQVDQKEISVANFFAGTMFLLNSLYLAFSGGGDAASFKAAGLVLLFAFTFLWVAINQYNEADGRGLGWYCGAVGVFLIPIALTSFQAAATTWDYWFSLCWALWALLFLLYFALLVLKTDTVKLTGVVAIINSVVTGWLPAYFLLQGIIGPAAAAH